MDGILMRPSPLGSMRLRAAAAVLLLAFGASARAAGDAARGAGVFATECSECHSVRAGKDKKGPSLFAVLGRHAAANPEFAYSDAMRASGLVWSAQQIEAYLTAPKRVVPGGKMKYDGLADAGERADLLAYLAAQH